MDGDLQADSTKPFDKTAIKPVMRCSIQNRVPIGAGDRPKSDVYAGCNRSGQYGSDRRDAVRRQNVQRRLRLMPFQRKLYK
ncbi:MAG: hypothetical protein LBG28_15515 [Tannerella sp.]|jgi:hypothetical protein|nr:hypothetical protein [Tannerella sp.]